MPKYLDEKYCSTKYDSITLHVPNWMIDKIREKVDSGEYESRSEYIKKAYQEYVRDYYFLFKDGSPGARILTVTSYNIPDLDFINDLCLEKKEISRSEMARNAIRWKLFREQQEKKSKTKDRISIPEGYIIVPGYNNDQPIKTRRLE